jgi:hypothetical protein
MRSAVIVLVCFGLSVAAPSQTPLVQFSNSIPRLTPPPGATRTGGGGAGIQPETQTSIPVGAGAVPAVHGYYRLLTELSAAAVIDHYEAQLVTNGWKVAFKQTEPALATVRFAAGTPTDPLTGMLVVVPFETGKQTLVSVRLIQNRWPWKGRAGGGGANANSPQPFSAELGSQLLKLPRSVTRAEFGSGSGTTNYMLYDMRLQAGDGPRAILAEFESQLPRKGWEVLARINDRGQAGIRRNSMPDPETDSSEIWMLTSMPGTSDIDLAFMSIQTWRGKK